MLIEALFALAFLLILTLLGLGPALWFLRGRVGGLTDALGIAPALGTAIVGLLVFPFARFGGPVETWALALLLVSGAVSLALVFWQYRFYREEITRLAWRNIALGASFVLLCCLVLLAPVVVNGIQFAAFRSNPSDALVYMSLAESMQKVPWAVLLRGAEYSQQNLDGLQALARVSPTALFTARMVILPLALNKPAFLAWLASISNEPVYRLYLVHHLLAVMTCLPLLLVMQKRLLLPTRIRFLGAAALTVGFWMWFILETDAGYEISTLPLLFLFVCAWMMLEEEPPRVFSKMRLLLGSVGAAIVTFYFPYVALIGVAFVLYYALVALQKRTLRPALHHLATLAMVIGVLLFTGQLDFYLYNVAYLVVNQNNGIAYPSPVAAVLQANKLAGVWGLGLTEGLPRLPNLVARVLSWLAQAFGLLLTLAFVVSAFRSLRPNTPAPARIVIMTTVSGILLALYFFVRGNVLLSGKLFGYTFPYLVLGMLLIVNDTQGLNGFWKRAATAVISVWLVSQIAVAFYLPYAQNVSGVFKMARQNKPHQYDLSAITNSLRAHPPQQLLVNIPRAKDWSFAYYTMLVFNAYPAHFQSGIIVDNNLAPQNFWTPPLQQLPDYAVVAKEADYFGAQGLGERVAETQDLVLYRVTTTNLQIIQTQEESIQLSEANKPFFHSDVKPLWHP
jgi:hypothetical protein